MVRMSSGWTSWECLEIGGNQWLPKICGSLWTDFVFLQTTADTSRNIIPKQCHCRFIIQKKQIRIPKLSTTFGCVHVFFGDGSGCGIFANSLACLVALCDLKAAVHWISNKREAPNLRMWMWFYSYNLPFCLRHEFGTFLWRSEVKISNSIILWIIH